MKKLINIGLVVALCVLLTGCFGGKTTKCKSSSEQKDYTISTEYNIKSSSKIVTKVSIKYVVESKDKKVLNNFKKQFEEQAKSNNSSYGGYACKASIKGKTLTANITIDYKKFDLKKFTKDNGAMKDYVNKDYKLTLDGATKMYKSTGATCK